jgi:hypothetical protein
VIKQQFISTLERVRADLAEALLAAHRGDVSATAEAVDAATERMQELVDELRAAA